MTVRIGWYVHHHGRGHLTRMLAMAPHLDADIDCFSSLPRPADLPPHCSWTVLDRDDDIVPGGRDPRSADPTAAGLLHWAPIDHPGHRNRLATIAAAVRDARPDAFVIDVSVEVALLVRLLGIRPVLIAQPGRRDDGPHTLGFEAATTIIAPWPEDLLAPAHLAPYRRKTIYTGGISRFEGRADADAGAGAEGRGDDVVLLGGRGGSSVSAADIAAAARASGRAWRVLGAAPHSSTGAGPDPAPDAAHGSGAGESAATPGGGNWTDDPWADLVTAHAVVSWAGQNAIADLAAAEAPAIVVPQDRPFAEQAGTALALERAGLAVIAPEWPDPAEWPRLIDRAAALRPQWSRWEVAGAADRAAAAIHATARGARDPA